MLDDWMIENLEKEIQNAGYIIWPRMTAPIQYINSEVGRVTARVLTLIENDNLVFKIKQDLENRKHKNFAFLEMSKDRRDYVDCEFIIRSMFGIRYASW